MSVLLTQLQRPTPIVLAPTGMILMKSMTAHVPTSPVEIADAAAARLGISAVHLHARHDDGAPAWGGCLR